MHLQIPIKALSVNAAYRGRRFKSAEYKQFEEDICKLVPMGSYNEKCKDPIYLIYIFAVHNYGQTDTANLEKPITDILVARGYLSDDRYIKSVFMDKTRAEVGRESIGVVITQDPEEYARLVSGYLHAV